MAEKKVGRPRIAKHKQRHVCAFRITNRVKTELIKKYGGIQKAVEYFLKREKDDPLS